LHNSHKVGKYLEANESENTINQSLWDAAKAVLRGKFIVINSPLKNQINNMHLN
jgi:hypothetical protein